MLMVAGPRSSQVATERVGRSVMRLQEAVGTRESRDDAVPDLVR